jgi:hypothetical protein
LLVPCRIERFVFKNIDTAQKGAWQERADARVTFEGIEKNEDLFGLRVILAFNESNNAMESHYGWVMENPLFLMTPDGEKIEPVGFETFQQDNTEVGMMYLFIEIPPGSTLHYETPAAVVTLDVPFSLKRIPLP